MSIAETHQRPPNHRLRPQRIISPNHGTAYKALPLSGDLPGRGFRCRRKHRTLSSHFDRLRSDRRRYSICHPVSRNISDWWIGHRSGNLRKSDTPQRVDVGCLPYGYPVAYLASTERRVRSVPVPSPPSLPELSLSLSWWRSSSPPSSPERPSPPISSPPGAAAFFAAHRFFKAATIAALPAALSLRFGFEGSGVAGCDGDSVVPLIAAHRFCCPRAIRRRAAAEILRFGGAASGVAAGSGAATGQHGSEFGNLNVDTSASVVRILSMAALMISGVSLFVGIKISMPS